MKEEKLYGNIAKMHGKNESSNHKVVKKEKDIPILLSHLKVHNIYKSKKIKK